MKEKDKINEEKHAINKGGFYANLNGSTKGFTIFIIICSIVFILFILLLVI